jgi:hypothetical protein
VHLLEGLWLWPDCSDRGTAGAADSPRSVGLKPYGSTVGVARLWLTASAGALLVLGAACAGQPAPVPLPAAGPASPTDSAGPGSGVPAGPGGGWAGPGGPPGGTPTGSSAPTSPPRVDRSDPLVVYRTWWVTVQQALSSADPALPDLASYAVDPLLANTRASLARLHGEGVVQVVSFGLAPRVVIREPDRVELTDCVRAPAGTYRDAVTGKPRAPTGFRNDVSTGDSLRFVLRPKGGAWYVVGATALGGGRC